MSSPAPAAALTRAPLCHFLFNEESSENQDDVLIVDDASCVLYRAQLDEICLSLHSNL
jgi:hypothetical protein